MIRGLRGDAHMGNFYVDMWRGVVYLFLPVAFVRRRDADGLWNADDDGWQRPCDDRRSRRDGHDRHWCRQTARHCPRTGRRGRCHQAARHQWRRILRHEFRPIRSRIRPLGATLIECVCIIMLPIAGAGDVRPHAAQYAACAGDLRRHVRVVDCDDRLVHPLGHGPAEPWADRHKKAKPYELAVPNAEGRKDRAVGAGRCLACRSISRWGIWKGKNCASALPPAPLGPR